jgi:ribosomal protein L36
MKVVECVKYLCTKKYFVLREHKFVYCNETQIKTSMP